MAFVNVPKDLSKVKTKVALNLTKRQLICFGVAALLGIPAYILTRGFIGNSPAALLMIVIMLPMFFFAMYEKDGQPAEIVFRNMVRVKLAWPGKRPYKSENLYDQLEKEAKIFANRKNNAAAAANAKKVSGKRQQRKSAS
jgi:hypothetical protein